MAMGDFSPWTSSGNTTASTPALAATTTPAATTAPTGFFGTTTGAQNVTNALTGTATGPTSGVSSGAAAANNGRPTNWHDYLTDFGAHSWSGPGNGIGQAMGTVAGPWIQASMGDGSMKWMPMPSGGGYNQQQNQNQTYGRGFWDFQGTGGHM